MKTMPLKFYFGLIIDRSIPSSPKIELIGGD
jgi:hypothetical protein